MLDVRFDDQLLSLYNGVGTDPVATAMAKSVTGNFIQIRKFIVLKTREPFA